MTTVETNQVELPAVVNFDYKLVVEGEATGLVKAWWRATLVGPP
jgi:hypothetical protein